MLMKRPALTNTLIVLTGLVSTLAILGSLFGVGWAEHLGRFTDKLSHLSAPALEAICLSTFPIISDEEMYAERKLYNESTPAERDKEFRRKAAEAAEAFRHNRPCARDIKEMQANITAIMESEYPNSSYIGVVFYGRRRYMLILKYYLERNLKRNGGILDKVLFIKQSITGAMDNVHMKYFFEHIQDIEDFEFEINNGPYWDSVNRVLRNYKNESESFFVKIDDDIVFIKDGSFEALLLEKLTNKKIDYFSGNVVNNKYIQFIHRHLGVFDDLLAPEYITNDFLEKKVLPTQFVTIDDIPPMTWEGKSFQINGTFSENITLPEPYTFEYDSWGWSHGHYLILCHKAFLHHAMADTLDQYSFPLWEYTRYRCGVPGIKANWTNDPSTSLCTPNGFYRWQIQVIIFRLEDLLHKGPREEMRGNDEVLVSSLIPEAYGLRTAVVGQSLFVHHWGTQQRQYNHFVNNIFDEYITLDYYMNFTLDYITVPFGERQLK